MINKQGTEKWCYACGHAPCDYATTGCPWYKDTICFPPNETITVISSPQGDTPDEVTIYSPIYSHPDTPEWENELNVLVPGLMLSQRQVIANFIRTVEQKAREEERREIVEELDKILIIEVNPSHSDQRVWYRGLGREETQREIREKVLSLINQRGK